MFDSTKDDLKEILKQAHAGKLQLPDFQRSYVWGDEDVRSLLASVAKGFPVGALLTLQTGGDVSFKPRLLEGVPAKDVRPDELLLDGQQRITSLYQATYALAPVKTRSPKNVEVERHYYIDIKKSLTSGANLEDAIFGVPKNKIIKKDFGKNIELDISSAEREFELDMFPVNLVFDSRDWFYAWRDYWKGKQRDIADLERDFYRAVVERIERYKMPIIRLDRSNSREAICLVFEKVNVGGKKLDAFELVTAIYASDNFDLREDWDGPIGKPAAGRRARILGSPHPRDVLREIASTDILQACTLLHTLEKRKAKVAEGLSGKELPQISCRRDSLLALPLDAYRKHIDAIETGFVEAGKFLNEHKIIWHKDVPYPPQIVAIGAVFAIMGKEALNTAAKNNLARWFWTIALGERYGSATDSKLAQDVPQLVDWLRGIGPQPMSLNETLFQLERLKTLRIRISAAYKAIHALLMQRGCRDFITGRPTDIMTFFDDKIDIHHIFPKDWCKKQGIKPSIFNSIVNKTPLSKISNIMIQGHAPSIYLKRIEEKHKIAPLILDEILRTHLIEPEFLRKDDFAGFFDDRIKSLSGLIADAMGKPVVEEAGLNESEVDLEADDEDIEKQELEDA